MLRKITLLLSILILTGVARAVINDPILYYTMDNADISGTTATDRGSGGNNGTLAGTYTTGVTGKISQAVSFDGSTAYLSAGDPANLKTLSNAGQNCTFAAWFKTSMIGTGSIIEKYWPFQIRIGSLTTGKITVRLYNGSIFLVTDTSISTLNNNAWHHVCWTIDRSGNSVLYIDGSANATTDISAHSTDVFNNTFPFVVGARSDVTPPNLFFFNGSIDEVRIYNRALSSSEVTALYNYAGSSSTLFRRNLNLRSGSRSPMSLNFHQPTPVSPLEQFKTILRRIAA